MEQEFTNSEMDKIFGHLQIDELILTLAISLCNLATGMTDQDEISEEMTGLTPWTAFYKCIQYIEQISEELENN